MIEKQINARTPSIFDDVIPANKHAHCGRKSLRRFGCALTSCQMGWKNITEDAPSNNEAGWAEEVGRKGETVAKEKVVITWQHVMEDIEERKGRNLPQSEKVNIIQQCGCKSGIFCRHSVKTWLLFKPRETLHDWVRAWVKNHALIMREGEITGAASSLIVTLILVFFSLIIAFNYCNENSIPKHLTQKEESIQFSLGLLAKYAKKQTRQSMVTKT